MLPKTHLAISVLILIFFLPQIVGNKFIFAVVLILSSLLPDIENGFSNFRRRGPLKLFGFLKNHRGLFHSFTLCILVSIVLAFYWPFLALPFFLGYAFHLLADSWTVQGIRPFWPWKKGLNGHVSDGSVIEHTVFMIFVVLDAVMLIITLL